MMSTATAAPMAIQTVVDDVPDGGGCAALTMPLPADVAGIPSQPSVTVAALTMPLPADAAGIPSQPSVTVAALTMPLPADAAGIPSQPSVTVAALTMPLPAVIHRIMAVVGPLQLGQRRLGLRGSDRQRYH